MYSLDKMKIENRALIRGIKLYEMAIWKFLGNSLITRLQNGKLQNDEDIRKALQPDTAFGKGYWVDLSGLICPYEALDQLLRNIENGEITTLEEVNSSLAVLHNNYYNFEWTWASEALAKYYGKSMQEITAEDVINIVKKWKASVLEMDNYLYQDAKKEFSMSKMTGFGVDGTNGAREEDFTQVRGEFESNSTVIAINEHIEKKEKLGNKMVDMMQKILQPEKV